MRFVAFSDAIRAMQRHAGHSDTRRQMLVMIVLDFASYRRFVVFVVFHLSSLKYVASRSEQSPSAWCLSYNGHSLARSRIRHFDLVVML